MNVKGRENRRVVSEALIANPTGMTVSDLVKWTGLSRSTVMRHLEMLRRGGAAVKCKNTEPQLYQCPSAKETEEITGDEEPTPQELMIVDIVAQLAHELREWELMEIVIFLRMLPTVATNLRILLGSMNLAMETRDLDWKEVLQGEGHRLSSLTVEKD